MKIEPYRIAQPRLPVGLVTSTRRVICEDGSRPRLRDVSPEVRLYGDGHLVNVRFLRRGDGSCYSWNDRPVRWLPDLEHKVIMLQGYPGDSDETMAGLVSWRDHLHAANARIGSPATASLSLLRATLAGPLYLGSDRPRLSQVLGGRQESFVSPGVYGAFAQLDIAAAYARALGRLVYPGGSWRRLRATSGKLPVDPELPMLVRAVVAVPPGIIGPLPVRPRRKLPPGLGRYTQEIEYPSGRDVQGIYSWIELAGARRAGCNVRVLDAWMNLGAPIRPFERWWWRIKAGRRLSGYAGELFKSTGNTLWGRFALDGAGTLDRYRDGRRVSSEARGRTYNPAYNAEDVSELVASSVRARLYSELIAPFEDRLISVHTDGGLVREPFTLADARLTSDWRVKRTGSMCIFIGPQMYAYVEGREFHHVCSGVSPESAPAAFAGVCRQVLDWPPTVYGSRVTARDRRRLEALCVALDVRMEVA